MRMRFCELMMVSWYREMRFEVNPSVRKCWRVFYWGRFYEMLGEICEWLGENLREVWGGFVSGWGEFARGLGRFCK